MFESMNSTFIDFVASPGSFWAVAAIFGVAHAIKHTGTSGKSIFVDGGLHDLPYCFGGHSGHGLIALGSENFKFLE